MGSIFWAHGVVLVSIVGGLALLVWARVRRGREARRRSAQRRAWAAAARYRPRDDWFERGWSSRGP